MWFLVFLSLFLAEPVLAAEDPQFTQFKNDYTFQYKKYLDSQRLYLEKKDIYTKYGTVSTEADKLTAAKTAINDRNSALKSYIQALRVYLNTYKDTNVADTEKLQIELQNWENWLNEQLTVVPNINNSKDLSSWSTDFQTKYVDIQQAIYSALTINNINHQKFILGLINTLTETIKNDPGIKPENQSWIDNLTIKKDLANQSLDQAKNLTIKKPYQTKFNNFYPEAKNLIQSATRYFTDIHTDLKIIIIKSNGN